MERGVGRSILLRLEQYLILIMRVCVYVNPGTPHFCTLHVNVVHRLMKWINRSDYINDAPYPYL